MRLPIPTEHAEQVAVCRWLDMRGVVYTAVPNGGKRHIVAARKLKAEGVSAGFPDLIIVSPPRRDNPLLAPLPPCHAIEMKRRKGGRLSLEQDAWLAKLQQYWWKVAVCHGADEAIKQLEEWGF